MNETEFQTPQKEIKKKKNLKSWITKKNRKTRRKKSNISVIKGNVIGGESQSRLK